MNIELLKDIGDCTGVRTVITSCPERSINPPATIAKDCDNCDGKGITKCEACGASGEAVTEWQKSVELSANRLRNAARLIVAAPSRADYREEFEASVRMMRDLITERVHGGKCSECSGKKECACPICGGDGNQPFDV